MVLVEGASDSSLVVEVEVDLVEVVEDTAFIFMVAALLSTLSQILMTTTTIAPEDNQLSFLNPTMVVWFMNVTHL